MVGYGEQQLGKSGLFDPTSLPNRQFLKNSLLSNYFTTFSIIFALEVIYVSCVHGHEA